MIVEARDRLPVLPMILGAEQAQSPGWLAWAGLNQKLRSTARGVSPSRALRNAGGVLASCQCRPRSAEV
jgi:hypothetical protein